MSAGRDPLNRLRELRVVPVIVIDDADDAIPLAAALAEGGLPCVEITFRTPAAAEAIERIVAEYPDFLVGAGTVLTLQQVDQARAAGAGFVVTPGFSATVVDRCLEQEIPVYPGVSTPSEISAALEMGLKVLKFFPAEPLGGVKYLKAIAAPFTDVEFLPTGGLSLARLPEYLAEDRVVACGGSWMAPADWIRAKDFELIRRATERAVAAVRNTTGGR